MPMIFLLNIKMFISWFWIIIDKNKLKIDYYLISICATM